MRGSSRRAARRACLVASGACLLVALTSSSSPAQEDDTVPRPEVFRGAASSLVASVQVDRDALLAGGTDLFRFIALDGDSSYESSTQTARASIFFPGNGLILGPSLACGELVKQFPPEFKPIFDTCAQYNYPLTVQADESRPDGATSGSLALASPSDPVSGNAVRATAHAAEDAATTAAAMQDLRVLGLPFFGPVTPQIGDFEMDTSLLTVDSAISRTNQRIVKGALVADAEATLSGVRMIGGLIRIGSLRSVSHVTDDANGARTAVATLEMSGVTVGGVPAQITDKGLVLGSPADGGPLAQQQQSQLNELLSALDVSVTALGSEQSNDSDGIAVASVGGLLIEFSRDVEGIEPIPTGLPLVGTLDLNGTYSGSIQLGATGVRGGAASFDLDVVPPDLSPDLGGGGFDPGGSGFDGGADGALPEVVTGVPSTTAAPDGNEQASPMRPARSLGDLFGDRIGLLYLSLMFATLGLCIVPRLTVPARLPGHRL